MVQPTRGKWRALRIPLAAHASADRLSRARWILTLVAVGAGLGWLLTGLFSRDYGSARYSPGCISEAHAQLSCSHCHEARAPMRDNTFAVVLFGKEKVAPNDPWSRPADKKCRACHQSDADPIPVHPLASSTTAGQHAKGFEAIDLVGRCATCHTEHEGTDHLLIPQLDDTCRTCHQDLTECLAAGVTSRFANRVTSFAAEHAVFRSLDHDPGTIFFNHALHTSVGVAGGQRASMRMRPDNLPAALKPYLERSDTDRIRVVNDDEDGRAIQLTCKFCHEQSAEDGRYEEGYFMTMPTFQVNCLPCHDMNLLPGSPTMVKHPRNMSSFFESLRLLQESDKAAATSSSHTDANQDSDWVSGATPVDAWRTFRAAAGEGGAAAPPERVSWENRVMRHVRQQCALCHQLQDERQVPDSARFAVAVMSPSSAPATNSRVMPHSWFRFARFNHAAHLYLNSATQDCTQCHARATKSDSATAVMIDNYQSCLVCHTELPGPGAGIHNARKPPPTNCIACHDYHPKPLPTRASE